MRRVILRLAFLLIFAAVFLGCEQEEAIKRDVSAALTQYLSNLDPESEITARYGQFSGLSQVFYTSPLADHMRPIVSATAHFENANAFVRLEVRGGKTTQVTLLLQSPTNAEMEAIGCEVILKNGLFWSRNATSEGQIELIGLATHPKARQ